MEKNLKLIYFGSEKSHGQQKQLPGPKRLWWVVDLEESAQSYNLTPN
jgi:ribosomal protein L24E